jgi:hypothetical protein
VAAQALLTYEPQLVQHIINTLGWTATKMETLAEEMKRLGADPHVILELIEERRPEVFCSGGYDDEDEGNYGEVRDVILDVWQPGMSVEEWYEEASDNLEDYIE